MYLDVLNFDPAQERFNHNGDFEATTDPIVGCLVQPKKIIIMHYVDDKDDDWCYREMSMMDVVVLTTKYYSVLFGSKNRKHCEVK